VRGHAAARLCVCVCERGGSKIQLACRRQRHWPIGGWGPIQATPRCLVATRLQNRPPPLSPADPNTLIGGAKKDILIGNAGADSLRGGANYDNFVFYFGDSLAAELDTMEDFTYRKDRMQLFTTVGGNFAPTKVTVAPPSNATTTVEDLAAAAFLNSDRRFEAPPAPLQAGAAVFAYANDDAIKGMYVIVDDGDGAFDATKDLVIKIGADASGTLPATGELKVSHYFLIVNSG